MNRYTAVILLLLGMGVRADTLAVWQGQVGGGTDDATLSPLNSLGASYYEDPYLEVRNGTSDLRYTIIRFPDLDDATVPDIMRNAHAKLRLRLTAPSGAEFSDWVGNLTVYASLVDLSWTEFNYWGSASVAGRGSPGWMYRNATSVPYSYWQSFDEGTPLNGIAGDPFDTVLIGTTPNVWVEFEIPMWIVSSWLNSPSTNYGILLHTVGNGTDYDGDASLRRFFSSDCGVDSVLPRFQIVYTSATLPWTTSTTYDTLHLIDDSVTYTSPGAAITLSHAHSKVPFNGNTLFVDSLGVQISADSCKLYNGTVEQRAAATREYAVMVNINSAVDSLEVRDVNVHARTANSAGLRAGNVGNTGGPNQAVYITGGNYTSYVTDFDTREYQYTAPIFIADDDSSPLETVRRAHVTHTTIDSCPHAGIVVNGGWVEVDSNFVRVDAQNHYTFPSGGIFEGTSNAYGIAIDRIGRNCKVIGNTVYSGSNHGGGRGIAFDGQASWTTWRSLEMAHNIDSTHVGPDAYYSGNEQSIGLRVRDTGTDSLYVHHNTIIVTCDTAWATEYKGPKAIGVWLTNAGEHWRFEYNTIKAIAVSPYGTIGAHAGSTAADTSGSYARAIAFDDISVASAPDSIIFRYNHIESNVIPISYGEVNSGTSSNCGYNVYSYNDTIVRGTPDYVDNWGNDGMWAASLASCNFYDNYWTDLYLVGDTTVDRDGVGPYEMWWRKTMTVTVVDSNAAPVENAEVLITNFNGDTVLWDTTNASGLSESMPVSYRLYQYGQLDSTYNPFLITVQTDADSVSESQSFGWATSGNITMIVSAAASDVDYIEHTITMGSNSGAVREYMQGIPREHISASDVDSQAVWVVMGNFGFSNIACIRKYNDHLNSLADTAGATINYLNNHAHHTLRGDTLNLVTPLSEGKRTMRYDLSPSIQLLNTVDVNEAATGDTQGGLEIFGSADNLMMIGRNPDIMDIWSWQSTNRGQSWTSTGYMTNYNADTRYDIDRMGTDSLSVVVFVNNRYIWHMFNGSTWSDVDTIGYGGAVTWRRNYCTEVGKDKTVHVVWSDQAATSHVMHSWRNPTTGVWTRDTIYTASASAELWPAMSYTENGQILRLIYTKATSTTPNSVVGRRWDYATNTWNAQELTLSTVGATEARNLAGSRPVPSIHNGRAYFGFTEQVSGTWYWRLVTILGGATNSPPVATGIPDQTINEGASFATIALDNYVTDPDDADADLTWTNYTLDVQDDFIVTITDRVATVSALHADSNGCDTIVFHVADPSDASDEDTAIFTINAVNDAPVVAGIPDQVITAGGFFSWVALYAYVADVDNDVNTDITWTYSGYGTLTIDTIITDPLVVSLYVPSVDYTGTDTVTFTATDTGAASDSDVAIFTVSAAPIGWHKIKGLKRGHKP